MIMKEKGKEIRTFFFDKEGMIIRAATYISSG
jgi:hypothetical protein